MNKHKFKIQKIKKNDTILIAGKHDSRLICIEQEIDGERHDFFLFKIDLKTGRLKTRQELIDEYRSFAAERLRAWGKKPGATESDINFEGLDVLESFDLDIAGGISIAEN